MTVLLTINGQDFDYPGPGPDEQWGPEATDWATAVSTGLLQKEGGLFTLLSEVDFGATYGLKAAYYKSRSSNVADAGVLRLARTDGINWRNEANLADLVLGVDSSDRLTFNGTIIQQSLSVTDTATIDLTLAADVLSAAIVTGSIDNSLVSASAAIAYSKLAALTVSRALVSDGSGFVSAATTTATEIGYVNGVTSSIQTQLNSKQATGNYITALTGDVTASGPGSVAATIAATSNATLVTLSALTTAASLVTVGTISTGVWSATTIAVNKGGTGLTAGTSGGILGYTATGTLASSALLATGQVVLGGGAGATPTTLAAGTQYQVLVMGATTPRYGQVNLSQAAAITGTLPIGNGGTGQTTVATAFGALSPLTTKGDILAYSTLNTRLAVGADGTVLTASSAAATGLTWTSPLTNPMNSVGDIIIGGAAGAATRLAAGTAGQVLQFNGTTLAWGSPTFQTLTAQAANYIVGQGDATASTTAGTLRGPARTGADAAGVNTTFDAANGTGTGGSGALIFRTAPVAGSSSTANTFATRLFIDKTGTVGVGTGTPSTTYTLDVAGPTRSTTANNGVPAMRLGSPSGFNGFGVLEINCDRAATANFKFIDMYSAASGSPVQKGYIGGDGLFYSNLGFQANMTSSVAPIAAGYFGSAITTADIIYLAKFLGDADVTGWYFQCQDSDGVSNGGIQGNGAASVAFVTSSDGRLKEDIKDLDQGIAFLDALKPRSFKWKNYDRQDVGFIAQELLEVAPEVVCGGDPGKQIGGETQRKNPPMGVDYGKLSVRSLQAAKDVLAYARSLEARIAILEKAAQI